MRMPWRRKPKTVTVIQVDTKKLIRVILFSLLGLVALIGTVWIILCQITLKTCEVIGDTRYDVGELRRAAGITREDKLYRLDTDELEASILSECLYIKSVRVKRSFPNKLIFVVEERRATWYLEIADDFYVLDEEMLVIEETGDEERLIRAGITKLTLPNLTGAICGEFPVFGTRSDRTEEENHREITVTCELLVQFQKSSLKPRMTYLDLESRFDVNATLDDRIEIYFGTYHQMDTKLQALTDTLERSSEYSAGEIDVSDPTTPTFRPRLSQEEAEENG